MSVYLADPDVTIHCGDVLAELPGMEDGSVDCCVTSPPYWGLRDYGTGEWEGGDEGCDHRHATEHQRQGATSARAGRSNVEEQRNENYRDVCGKCGARRIDRQLGLEPTPEEYVARMVAVFREVRRVLASHGTLWLNIGDSYAGSWGAQSRPDGYDVASTLQGASMLSARQIEAHPRGQTHTGSLKNTPGLKPKDLCMIPARLALALQADGWWLRSDIIWSKPNPMPESVTDRPTKAHEYVFLLTKAARYFYDADAVREPNVSAEQAEHNARYAKVYDAHTERVDAGLGIQPGNVNNRGIHSRGGATVGRNLRSVWEIATEPYPEAHFATYPTALVERCLKAGCPSEVCRTCGKPRVRIVEAERVRERGTRFTGDERDGLQPNNTNRHYDSHGDSLACYDRQTVGFSDCGHDDYRPGLVLDPFLGSGTTAHVARKLDRRTIGIELNPDYCALAARRLAQQSLLVELSA